MIDPTLLSQVQCLEGPHALALWGDGAFVLECSQKSSGDWSRGWCSPPCDLPPVTVTPGRETTAEEFR